MFDKINEITKKYEGQAGRTDFPGDMKGGETGRAFQMLGEESAEMLLCSI
jgi:hypothetical protein